MKFLLVGNSTQISFDYADREDVGFVQFNCCNHWRKVPRGSTKFLFVTNSGLPEVSPTECILKPELREWLGTPVIVIARNKIFYRVKAAILRLRKYRNWKDFQINPAVEDSLRGHFKVVEVGLWTTILAELALLSRGMKLNEMPSTGFIAFMWMRKRAEGRDAFDWTGFEHCGWEGHPWNQEEWVMADYRAKHLGNSEGNNVYLS